MKYKLEFDTDRAPRYGSEEAAGIDLYYNGKEPKILIPNDVEEFETHLAVEIPQGHFGMLVIRSGFGWKGLTMINSVGIIDSDYRGQIGIKIKNQGFDTVRIEPKERVAQLIIVPYVRVTLEDADCLAETTRGTKGFGSTGVK